MMLINTVILFLSNSLTIFIALALLLSLKDKHSLSGFSLFIGGIVGLVLMLILWFFMDTLAQAINDTGIEWFYAGSYFLAYCFILLFIHSLNKPNNKPLNRASPFYLASTLALIIMVQGTSFIVYFLGYWSQENVANALFVGIILGVGICVSIGILWYFLCHFLNENIYEKSSELLLLFFACGLLNKTSNLLLQIDFLPSTSMAWDINFIVKENSELGHFLAALLGYDASPTLLQVLIYFTALLVALLWCQLPKKPWRYFRIKEVIS
jgi:high-affinity iron transporter